MVPVPRYPPPGRWNPCFSVRGLHPLRPSTAVSDSRFKIPWVETLESGSWNLELFLTAVASLQRASRRPSKGRMDPIGSLQIRNPYRGAGHLFLLFVTFAFFAARVKIESKGAKRKAQSHHPPPITRRCHMSSRGTEGSSCAPLPADRDSSLRSE